MNHGTVSIFCKTLYRFCELFGFNGILLTEPDLSVSILAIDDVKLNTKIRIGFLMVKVMSFCTHCDQLHYHSQAVCKVPSVCEWCSFTTKSVCLRNVMFQRTVGKVNIGGWFYFIYVERRRWTTGSFSIWNKVVFVHFVLSILSISEVWREKSRFASQYFTLVFLLLSNKNHMFMYEALITIVNKFGTQLST